MKRHHYLIFFWLICTTAVFFNITEVSGKEQMTAVVITASAGWTSGAHSIVSGEPVNGHRSVQNKLLPSISDMEICSYGPYFYRIERFQSDNISKFHISNPGNVIWNVPAQSSDEADLQSQSSNPSAMIFASKDKAYLIRYGARTVWIVNPSVSYANRHQFKIGQLDLSAYADENGKNDYDDTDGYPEMCGGKIVDGKLFIVMQRLVDWCPKESVHSYVAVFDVHTDTEIDTHKGEGSLKGIKLPSPVYNAGFPENSSIHYLKDNNTLYVSGPASIGFCSSGVGGKGGIVSIDPTTYETKVVLDGSTDNWEYGNIFSTAIVSPFKGYFVSVPDANDIGGSKNSVHSFNPSTGEILDTFSSIGGKDIWSMALDRQKKLWLCNSSDSEIVIMNTSNNSIEERVAIDPLPKVVSFVYTYDFEVGDVNKNGIISAQDAVDAYKLALKNEWTSEQLWGADFNGDGEITAQDAIDIFWAGFK
jgi:hypothetical protein